MSKSNKLISVFLICLSVIFVVLLIGFEVSAEESGDTGIYYPEGFEIATASDAAGDSSGSPDKTLYLSEQYSGKNIDDIYSMLLSIRNILLLFFFAFVLKWFDGKLKTIFRTFKS